MEVKKYKLILSSACACHEPLPVKVMLCICHSDYLAAYGPISASNANCQLSLMRKHSPESLSELHSAVSAEFIGIVSTGVSTFDIRLIERSRLPHLRFVLC